MSWSGPLTQTSNSFREDQDDNIGSGFNNVSLPGDPTGKMATRLSTSKQLNYLTEVVGTIEQVYNALPDDYKKLVRLKYWSRNSKMTWEGIALKIGKSERQARRWRKELITASIEIKGWR